MLTVSLQQGGVAVGGAVWQGWRLRFQASEVWFHFFVFLLFTFRLLSVPFLSFVLFSFIFLS
jgi:hypothetical protein